MGINQALFSPAGMGSVYGGSSGVDLKTEVKFLDLMKDKMIEEYAEPDGEMTLYGRTLVGEDRYGALGVFLVGKFFQDYTNIVDSLINSVTLQNKIANDLGKLLGSA
ncbi:hypothetical protein A3H38_06415 [candidate division WOR-1 bacterium RIFCSPLOWO2_02_FULL_46_20]|uniref:Uncharacterized protein n=1 Tax=candidate division WOR-1 bacterium RIFCSPLOWO2_02_FULL_46_20 TaxID=1802567 RepID=A0A1F4RH01_UNCSA|nr:MAG: hypothetical protein A3H38_06415 [candidate division WOR-1 bacterium RIFCSPLOWO2_02_FULL_46_20]